MEVKVHHLKQDKLPAFVFPQGKVEPQTQPRQQTPPLSAGEPPSAEAAVAGLATQQANADLAAALEGKAGIANGASELRRSSEKRKLDDPAEEDRRPTSAARTEKDSFPGKEKLQSRNPHAAQNEIASNGLDKRKRVSQSVSVQYSAVDRFPNKVADICIIVLKKEEHGLSQRRT